MRTTTKKLENAVTQKYSISSNSISIYCKDAK